MTWLFWLVLVAIAVTIVTLLRGQPDGGRPVERTRLMAIGRVVLVIGGLAAAAFIYWSR